MCRGRGAGAGLSPTAFTITVTPAPSLPLPHLVPTRVICMAQPVCGGGEPGLILPFFLFFFKAKNFLLNKLLVTGLGEVSQVGSPL